jgi:multiple sugar transport system permease protein
MFAQPIPYIPDTITFIHFREIFFASGFITYYYNSIVVAIGVIIVTVVSATLGGYGLTRLDIPFKKTFARGVLFGYMFPAILLSIPMFIIWREIGLINSYTGLVLAEAAGTLPFSLWLMWQFFQTVPVELEESAYTMGASRFRTLVDIALPNAKPGIIAISIFAYSASWDQYTIPKILMTQSSMWPLTVGVYDFTTATDVLWGQIMAASSMMLIPSFLFVIFLQKYMLEGFRIGE